MLLGQEVSNDTEGMVLNTQNHKLKEMLLCALSLSVSFTQSHTHLCIHTDYKQISQLFYLIKEPCRGMLHRGGEHRLEPWRELISQALNSSSASSVTPSLFSLILS